MPIRATTPWTLVTSAPLLRTRRVWKGNDGMVPGETAGLVGSATTEPFAQPFRNTIVSSDGGGRSSPVPKVRSHGLLCILAVPPESEGNACLRALTLSSSVSQP